MACMHICPTQAIRVRNRKARLLRDRCIGCGLCVVTCPSGALELVPVSKEEWFEVPSSFEEWEERRLQNLHGKA